MDIHNMSVKNIESFKCNSEMTVLEAMKKINKNSHGLVFVVDNEDLLVGCLSDGNVRRWMINGGSINSVVREAMNSNPLAVSEDDRDRGRDMIRENRVRSVAVVDDTGHLTDVIVDSGMSKRKSGSNLSDFSVVIMAGGKGTRLYPYTKILPKPLIPIGDIPILERIMNAYTDYGIHDFYISVNYRKEMIKSYFVDLPDDYLIHYVEEDKPLGTAGSIRLIDNKFDKPIFITNCDILIDADYSDIMESHINSGNDLTIVSALKNTVIPYGVLHTRNGMVESMEEKPELSNFINTGMYVMNPEFISWIPEGELFHMTDLVDKMIQNNKNVGIYPIGENDFLDMGEMAELKKMEERINTEFT